ncbi:MAG: hypothetical protein V1838_02195 [Patescibacteria group bacterium]
MIVLRRERENVPVEIFGATGKKEEKRNNGLMGVAGMNYGQIPKINSKEA